MVLKRCGVNKKRKAEPNVSLEELSDLLASSTENESLKKGSIEILLNYITPQSNPEFVMAVLDEIMEFVKLKKKGEFYFDLYQSLIQALVYSPLEVDLFLDSLASNYFKYIDVRYFTLMSVEKTCNTLDKRIISGKCTTEGDGLQASLDHSINKIHFILTHIPPLGDSDTDFEVWSDGFWSKEGNSQESPKCKERRGGQEAFGSDCDTIAATVSYSPSRVKLKLKFTKAWMSFLKLPLLVEVYKEVLVKLPQAVIPYLSKPEMLCDFLTRSYDVGGVVSVMALSGVFVLMTQHGIEYPDFYQKLYSLLIPSVFMARHRAKFFELLDVCLKSPLLPAYLAAAFAKKLSRLSLVVPPSGALVIIALVYNLLRRHPSINFLVHQESHGETYSADGNVVVASDIIGGKQGVDVFNDDESDPLKSNAMRSSLWEIDTLRHHYCCPVSRFVLSLENDLTVRDKTTEMKVSDFSSASYSTIIKEEMRRRVKLDRMAKTTPTPTSTSLFSESEFPGWTFNCEG